MLNKSEFLNVLYFILYLKKLHFMKKFIVVLYLLLCSVLGFAQDVLTKKNGEDISSKVLEVTTTEIKYKKFDNLNGPTFTILKSEVLLIRYENGTKDVFNEPQKPVTQSQAVTERSVSFKKNEIKGNVLALILGSIAVTYERILNEESAVGFALTVPVDDYVFDINYTATAYYRYYFGEKPAAGFFGEAFGMLNSVDDYVYYDNFGSGYERKNLTDFAIGVGLGGKWVTKKGLILELNIGVGRNLFNNQFERDYTIIGRGGVSIGYRF
jgi:hypothetical protein